MSITLLIRTIVLILGLTLISQTEKQEVTESNQVKNSEESHLTPDILVPTDGDGNTYETVIIGTQEWLKTDLRTTKCNDGTPIPLVTDNNAWSSLRTGAYCWYNNDEATQTANGYGALYNWHATSECNICPVGWHVPTDAEWTTLIDYLDPANVDPTVRGIQSEVAGKKMKEEGFEHWKSNWNGSNGGTNESKWSGLPGGYRLPHGLFSELGFNGSWWSTTDTKDGAWRRNMVNFDDIVFRYDYGLRFGFSVRCIKD